MTSVTTHAADLYPGKIIVPVNDNGSTEKLRNSESNEYFRTFADAELVDGICWDTEIKEALLEIDYLGKPLFYWGDEDVNSNFEPVACYLSNWSTTPDTGFIGCNGLKFENSEQFMMFSKAMLFNDTYYAGAVLFEGKDPARAQALGRLVRGFDNQKWQKYARRLVAQGQYFKFSQNDKLRDLLLASGNRPLYEAAPTDKIWGIGLDREEAEKHIEHWRKTRHLQSAPGTTNSGNSAPEFPGLNWCGHCLMAVRRRLRRQLEQEMINIVKRSKALLNTASSEVVDTSCAIMKGIDKEGPRKCTACRGDQKCLSHSKVTQLLSSKGMKQWVVINLLQKTPASQLQVDTPPMSSSHLSKNTKIVQEKAPTLIESSLPTKLQASRSMSSKSTYPSTDGSNRNGLVFALQKQFCARNFKTALKYINDIGAVAEREGHHPDLSITSWNTVTVTLYTHAVNGITWNDMLLAQLIDEECRCALSKRWLREIGEERRGAFLPLL
eukprot:g2451.t1